VGICHIGNRFAEGSKLATDEHGYKRMKEFFNGFDHQKIQKNL